MAAAQQFTSGTDSKGEQAMVIALARLFRSRQWNRGFTLIELLIVILIVGILAAVATPLYLGYIKDAKTAEAKAVAGSLWTAVQSNAIGSCGNAVTIVNGLPEGGALGRRNDDSRPLVGGARYGTSPWRARRRHHARPDRVHDRGTTADVNFIRVRLAYAAGNSPPSRLQCSTDSGSTFVDC